MRTRAMLALLGLALHAQAEAFVVDDFASPQPTGWQVSGSPEYYKGGFGAKGVSIVPNADGGKPALRAAIHIRADAPTPACWLTKTLPSLPGLHRWERLTFRFKLTSTAGLAPDKALLCRFRTGPTAFTDLPFAQPPPVKVGEWQEATVRFDAFSKPVNIYTNYFESLKELTFRFGAEQGKRFDGEFWVSAIRFHAKAPPDWTHEPRLTPRPPSGLRRALLVTHSAASFYFVRETLEALGVPVERRFFRGLHFPIFDFPKEIAELNNSAMVVLADVDPYVLSRPQVEQLCDYVASGGGLLFVAGPNTLGMAKSFPRPLAEMLPVTCEEGRPLIAVNAAPRLATAHPVTSGLGSEMKQITKAHALRPKTGATVLLNAGPRTALGWGLYSGGGRDDGVLLLSEDAHSGRHSAMLETKKFYVDPKTGKPTFIGLKLMQGDSDGYAGSRAYRARPSTTYRFAFWLKGDAPQAKVGVTTWKTDEAKPDDREHLDTSLAPLKPTAAWERHEGTFTTKADTRRFALAFQVTGSAATFPLGTKILVDDVEITETAGGPNLAANPGAEEDASVPILTFGGYHRGRVALLNGYPEVADTVDCFFTTGEYRVVLARTCLWLAGEATVQGGEKAITELFNSVMTLRRGAAGLPGYVALEADFPPAARLDRGQFFPIISWLGTEGGGHLLDERALRERVDDLWEHGFNTIAIGGLRHFTRQPWTNRARLLDYAARYAQSRGMAVIFEYERLTNIDRGSPPKPCVFAPDYRAELSKQLLPKFEAARQFDRALSIKILDEPTATDKVLDYCELCRREFQKRFGRPLRKRADIPADDREGHRQLSQFIADYVGTGYQAIRQTAAEFRLPQGLLLTYMASGFGYADTRRGMQEALTWSRAADYMDFDVYPYFYPVSQNVRMLQAHFCFAVQRAISEHLGKPAGFYVELDDRNYPLQVNPVEASAECAWTAVGQGCRYLNSFIHVAFSTGSGARPERWECLGRELRKIREAGPMLLRVRKAPSPLALYFPYAQWLSGGKKFAPGYAYQLLLRAFGECDIAHEEVIAERGNFGPVKALAVVETDFLPEAAAAKLVAFVRDGGLLFCDDTAKLPAELQGHAHVVKFDGNLEQRFRDAVETPSPAARTELLNSVRQTLAKAGLTPHARAEHEDVETNVLTGDGIELLVAVNHAATPVETTVQLAGRREALPLRLPARNGALIPLKQ